MERTQRIARINALLSRPQGASLSLLMSELEVSRATINRDLQVMRDGMNAPIVWDSFERVYRLKPNGHAGPAYMLPGLWLKPAQAYAILTLNNMVQKIAPNVLGPFLDPMRGLLKQMLHDAEYKLRGLDRKIEIDMPAMPQIGDLDFENLVEALVNEQPARFVDQERGGWSGTKPHRNPREVANYRARLARRYPSSAFGQDLVGQCRENHQGHCRRRKR